jgi:phosphoribosylformylglycinamidine cyclo-ligase
MFKSDEAMPYSMTAVRTYAEAGVDQSRKASHISAIVEQLTYSRKGKGKPLVGIGHFTGLADFGKHALSLCTDSVGTKLLVATQMRKWDTVGIDCVAMNANDMICIGAEPIAFVDYFAVEKYNEEIARQIGIGLNEGARRANISIIGGEVAILPEVIRDFDLAGTCLGIVEKSKIVAGKAIKHRDVIIGLSSTGIHSNGLTLARRVFKEAGLSVHDSLPGGSGSVGQSLLEPTAIYVRPVMAVLRKHEVHGMAHFTGGGLSNIVRLKEKVEFVVTDPLEPQPIFRAIQTLAGIEDTEMYRTFNMGMGMCVVAPEDEVKGIMRTLGKSVKAKVVGEVRRGSGVSLPSMDVRFSAY